MEPIPKPPAGGGLVLHRSLTTVEYFAFGFGSMVGVGWLVLMDDWLQRGGPLGTMLAFLAGGLLLLPVARTYGALVVRIPEAGAEIAYAEGVVPPWLALRRRLGDDPRLRHRLPVGSGGDRQPPGSRVSGPQLRPAL